MQINALSINNSAFRLPTSFRSLYMSPFLDGVIRGFDYELSIFGFTGKQVSSTFLLYQQNIYPASVSRYDISTLLIAGHSFGISAWICITGVISVWGQPHFFYGYYGFAWDGIY